ncbi:thermonuclease family protein [Albirhodobacter sp. R86504]|uniref:thermonuclease family protein n=1 Tax=Albirhodobacter sp. R86504 TaxID=3093848 RepID=UPI00366C0D2E
MAVFTPEPARAVMISGVARVIDGDTLDLDGTRVRLFGIDAPEQNQTCADARGKRWECGAFATQSLRALVQGRVSCEPVEMDRYGRTVARCFNGAQDINAQMVAQGAAFAYRKYSDDYVMLEARAEQRGAGLWSGEAETPETFRAQARAASRREAEEPPRAGCRIKGNISNSGRIYHMPNQAFYAETAINEARGERWFCSAAEARAAGWRAAKR